MSVPYLPNIATIFGFKPKTDIRTKLFLVVSFLLIIGGTLAEIGNLFLILPQSMIIQTFILILILLALHIYARIKGEINLLLIFFFIFISILFIMVIWPKNGGFGGPILYYFFIIPFSTGFFLPRKFSYLSYFIVIVMISVFVIYYFNNPDEIIDYYSRKTQFIDNLISIFLTGWISMEISMYYKEQQSLFQTELQKKNELIELQIKALQDLDSHKNSVFAIMSHDINSPINNAASIINLIKDGNLDEEERNKIILASSENLNEISSLVSNILFWAKSQMNGIEINKTNFNVEQIINDIIHQESQAIRAKKLFVQTNIANNLWAFGDSELFKIVFRNLLKNAIKFSFDRSIVTVVSGINSIGEIEIEVADEGVGIPISNQDLIFTGSKSTQGTNNEKGNGLGLKLCKLFTETNGGRIEFISNENKGSNFIFTIPKGNKA